MVNLYCIRVYNCQPVSEISVHSLRAGLREIFGEPDKSERTYSNYFVREFNGAIEFIAEESFVPEQRARHILDILGYREDDINQTKTIKQTA